MLLTGETGQMMNNWMFFITFPNVAYALQYIWQSRNNNNRPNKKNDVITDLGGEGNFPMFLSGPPISPDFPPTFPDIAFASLRQRHFRHPVPRWMIIP